ncbi:hypothetical protein FRY15_02510 [Enterococcus faecium]|uniref:hypothetical protein n=2 Tax=Bacillota TaxID=1239 RepID=UPI000252F37B|nr:hypothetical protein [Enterococcus faecium]AFC63720.1 hypothetical protein EFAU004_01636 [Enterococcus faecium Aus0004]MBH1135763.1 hypothetical protein [Enterococcus faecium]MBK0934727.1 hypothetical protein [Enterococcus faecium]MDT9534186.1 hypothetical protein [Enterococcus faecium]MDT9549684.1 hypothetical protein [Enterococcus faecium]
MKEVPCSFYARMPGERQSRTVVPPCPHPAEMRTAAVRFSAKTPLKNAVLVLSEVRGTGTANFSPLKKSGSVLSETEGQESRSETEVLRMQENTETTRDRQLDEELADVLIAISVIAKRLARKLQTANQEGGTPDGEIERPGLTD